MSIILFLLFASSGLTDAFRVSAQGAVESGRTVEQVNMCTVKEQKDHVRFFEHGFSYSFAPKGGRCMFCKPYFFYTQAAPNLMKHSKDDATNVCSCFSSEGERQFDFLLNAHDNECTAKTCWNKYADAMYLAKRVEVGDLSPNQALNRPDHWEMECVDSADAAPNSALPAIRDIVKGLLTGHDENSKEYKAGKKIASVVVLSSLTASDTNIKAEDIPVIEIIQKAAQPKTVVVVDEDQEDDMQEALLPGDDSDDEETEGGCPANGNFYLDEFIRSGKKVVSCRNKQNGQFAKNSCCDRDAEAVVQVALEEAKGMNAPSPVIVDVIESEKLTEATEMLTEAYELRRGAATCSNAEGKKMWSSECGPIKSEHDCDAASDMLAYNGKSFRSFNRAQNKYPGQCSVRYQSDAMSHVWWNPTTSPNKKYPKKIPKNGGGRNVGWGLVCGCYSVVKPDPEALPAIASMMKKLKQ